ncbi:hypothetical protein niasHT_026932 [Heterodera trifolii]|uniref:RRM domain-containing protein n=1 Tax=Heterodera trifolii TaxID=157864 RepID=A0ABD2KRG5_9BILA
MFKALKAEGHDVQTYRFGMAELQSTQQMEGKAESGAASNELTAMETGQTNENAAMVETAGNDVEMSTEDTAVAEMDKQNATDGDQQQQNVAPIGGQQANDETTTVAGVGQQQKQPMETIANHGGVGDIDVHRNAHDETTVQPDTNSITIGQTSDDGGDKNNGHGDGSAQQMDQDEPDIIIETPKKAIKSECVEDVVLVGHTASASAVGSAGRGAGNGTKPQREVMKVTATAATTPSLANCVPSTPVSNTDQQLKVPSAVMENGETAAETVGTTTATKVQSVATTNAKTAVAVTNSPPPLLTSFTAGSTGDDVILINGDQQQQRQDKIGKEKNAVAAQPSDDTTGGKKQSASAATPTGTTTSGTSTAQLVDGNNLSSSLWIRNITTTTKAADLKALFSKHGKVITAKIFTTKNKQSPTCFGYVTLADSETANVCAQKLNRSNFKGRIINVEKADRSNLSQIGTQQQPAAASDVSGAKTGTAKSGSSSKAAGGSSDGGKGSGAEPSASASSSSSKKVRPRITAATASPTQRQHRNNNSSSAKTAAAGSSSRTSIRKRIAKNGAGDGGGGGTASKYDSALSRNQQRRYFRSVATASFGHRGGVSGPQYIVKSRSAAEPRLFNRLVHQTSRGIRVSAFEGGGSHQYAAAHQHVPGGSGGFRDFNSRRGVGPPGGSADPRRYDAGNAEREEMLRLMEQREDEHRKKEEELRLEREREKLKYEREKLERERLEVEHMKLTAQIQASGWLQAAALPAAGGFVAASPAGFGVPAAPQQSSARDSRQQQQQHYSRHHSEAAVAPARNSAKVKESSSSSKLSASVVGRNVVTGGRAKESNSSSRSHNDMLRRASSDRDRAVAHNRGRNSRSRSPIRRSSNRSDKHNLSGSSTATWQSKGGSSSASSRYVGGGKQRDGGSGGTGRSNSRARAGMSSSSSNHHQSSSYDQQQKQQFGGGTTALNPFSQPQPFAGGSSAGALSYGKQQQQQYSIGSGGGSSRMTSTTSAVSAGGGGGGYERHGQMQGRSYYNDRYADTTTAASAYASRTDPSYGQRIGQQFPSGGGARDEMYGVSSGGGGAFGDSGYATSSAQFASSRGQSSGGGGQPSSSSYYNSQSSAWANPANSRATEMVNSRAFGTSAGGTSASGSWSRQTDDILSEWNMYGSPSKMTGASSSSGGRYHQQQSMSYSGAGGRSGGSLYSGGGGGGGRRY